MIPRKFFAAVTMIFMIPLALAAEEPKPLANVHRVVFLGDSITHSGQMVDYAEAVLRVENPSLDCDFFNLGLPSETVSGLTEPGHAGGQFPRPDLHERLDRVLTRIKPDLVIACYGMNDGIYYPYSDLRFQKYRDGINRLREKVVAAGAKLILITPSVFDPVPIQSRTLPAGKAEYPSPYEGYDEVLDLYSAWLLAQRGNGWAVVDAHFPMKRMLMDRRSQDPSFRFAGDGVHIDSAGHWLMAQNLLQSLGVADPDLRSAASGEAFLAKLPRGIEVLKLVQAKNRVLKDSWLASIGHRRPGMNRGLPLEEAIRSAKALDNEMSALLNPASK